MTFLWLATAMLAAQQPSTAVVPREYRVDFGESIVEFSIKYAFARVKGSFVEGNGTHAGAPGSNPEGPFSTA